MKSVALPLLLLFAASVPTAALAASDAALQPVITIENPDSRCVAPAAQMRRDHMEMLKHQRDKTLRLGERGATVSLNGCIDCHASKKTGSVIGSNEDFCQSCHTYAAVTLDCFECHQSKAGALAKAEGTRP